MQQGRRRFNDAHPITILEGKVEGEVWSRGEGAEEKGVATKKEECLCDEDTDLVENEHDVDLGILQVEVSIDLISNFSPDMRFEGP